MFFYFHSLPDNRVLSVRAVRRTLPANIPRLRCLFPLPGHDALWGLRLAFRHAAAYAYVGPLVI